MSQSKEVDGGTIHISDNDPNKGVKTGDDEGSTA